MWDVAFRIGVTQYVNKLNINLDGAMILSVKSLRGNFDCGRCSCNEIMWHFPIRRSPLTRKTEKITSFSSFSMSFCVSVETSISNEDGRLTVRWRPEKHISTCSTPWLLETHIYLLISFYCLVTMHGQWQTFLASHMLLNLNSSFEKRKVLSVSQEIYLRMKGWDTICHIQISRTWWQGDCWEHLTDFLPPFRIRLEALKMILM